MKKTFIIVAMLAMLSPAFSGESARMTIYNRGIFQVSLTGESNFKRGLNEITFDNLPPDLYPESALLKPLSGKLSVISGDFLCETIDKKRLWEGFIGKIVTLPADSDTVSGLLMNYDDSYFYVLLDDGNIRLVKASDVTLDIFPAPKWNMAATPTLKYTVDNKGSAGEVKYELNYRAEGIGWAAYYSLYYSEGKAELSGDFIIKNKLAIGYDGVELSLIAGEPRLAGDREELPRNADLLQSESAGTDGEPLFAYYVYPISGKVDIPRNATKHIPFMSGEKFAAEEKNVMKEGFGLRNLEKVITFSAGKKPLPEGEIAVYLKDKSGHSSFVGEDEILGIPPGGMVEIRTGNNFDLIGERKRVFHNRLNRSATEDAVQVKLTNSSGEDANVLVRERVFGVWTVESAAYDGKPVEYNMVDSRKIEFEVMVKKNSVSTLEYKVRYEY